MTGEWQAKRRGVLMAMDGARRVLVIVNPAAGQRRRGRYEALLAGLRAEGCVVTVRPTGAPGDAEALARAARDDDAFDVIAAAGGDGTINEVINGLAGGARPLALLPLGTANVLAAEIGLPAEPQAVACVVARGVARPVCFGRANGRAFALMAGVGLDARVVAGVDLRLKRLVGKLAYAAATLGELRRYRPLLYNVEIEGQPHAAAMVVVANGHYYGGRYVCAPAARLADPSLHVCLFRRPGRLRLARYSLALMRGRLGELTAEDYQIVPATALTITGTEGEPMQLDGDIGARLPVRIELAAERLRLVMPA